MNDLLCNQFSQRHPDIRYGGREAEDGAGQVCPRGGQRGRQDQAHLRQGLQPEGQNLTQNPGKKFYHQKNNNFMLFASPKSLLFLRYHLTEYLLYSSIHNW